MRDHRKIVDYVIATGDSYRASNEKRGLIANVKDYLRQGYQPSGSMSIHNEDGSAVFYVQPMVKYEDESQPRVKYAKTLKECEEEERERGKKHHTNTVTPIVRNQYDEESRN